MQTNPSSLRNGGISSADITRFHEMIMNSSQESRIQATDIMKFEEIIIRRNICLAFEISKQTEPTPEQAAELKLLENIIDNLVSYQAHYC